MGNDVDEEQAEAENGVEKKQLQVRNGFDEESSANLEMVVMRSSTSLEME